MSHQREEASSICQFNHAEGCNYSVSFGDIPQLWIFDFGVRPIFLDPVENMQSHLEIAAVSISGAESERDAMKCSIGVQ